MNNEPIEISTRTKLMKARQLRKKGYIPGILYGFNQHTAPVLFNKREIERYIRKVGENTFFEIALEGEIKPVRIKEIQRDPVSKEIIHMDLQSIHMDRKLNATIPLRFEGINEIERKGFVFQHQIDRVGVEGLARDIPSYIKIPIGNLNPGDTIYIHDLEISEELSILNNKRDVVGSVLKIMAQEEEVEAPDVSTIESEND